jgi:hypothetical protein
MRRISVGDSMKVMKIQCLHQTYNKAWHNEEEAKSSTKELEFEIPNDKDELRKIYLHLAKLYHPDNKLSGLGSK